eukprot:4066428-Pleurochrysis_carterae.AAC.3
MYGPSRKSAVTSSISIVRKSRMRPEPARNAVAPISAKSPGSRANPKRRGDRAIISPKRRPMKPPMTIIGTRRPTGSGVAAAAAVKSTHATSPMVRANGESASGAPRKNSARPTCSVGWSSSVAKGSNSPCEHRPRASMSTALPVSVACKHACDPHVWLPTSSHMISARISSLKQRLLSTCRRGESADVSCKQSE